MAQEIRDASGALLYYELEHTAQNVDDAIDGYAVLQSSFTQLYNGLMDCDVPVLLQDSNGETILDSNGDALFGRTTLASGAEVEQLRRECGDLSTLYHELASVVSSQRQTIAALQEALSPAQE